MKTVLVRLSGFTLLPLLSLITPLILLPIVAGLVGGAGVSSVVSGQAIGTFAAAVITWGWSVEGPVAIARAGSEAQRAQIYLASMRDRVILSVVVLPLACWLAALIAAPGFAAAAIAMAIPSAIAGFSPAWFGIGLGQPRLLAIYDTGPRFLATLAAIPLLILTRELWPYAATSLVATAVALVVFQRRYARGGAGLSNTWRDALAGVLGQRHTAAINLSGSVYASAPAPIATATLPVAASGSLATADTLYRFSLFAVAALGNALQGWTLEPESGAQRKRQLAAIWLHAGLGLVGLAGFVVAGPWATSILFAGQAQATLEMSFYYGLAFLFISLGTPLVRNILIPAGRQQLILRWTLVSVALGVAAMVAAGLSGDAAKVALGMALSEALLCLSLAVPAWRELSKLDDRRPATPQT